MHWEHLRVWWLQKMNKKASSCRICDPNGTDLQYDSLHGDGMELLFTH
jgi:hypothetical protein